MPELPEVEALARHLTARLAGLTITRADVLGIATLKTVAPAPRDLVDKRIVEVTRRGKFLDVVAPPLHLILHLSRAGWIRWHEELPTTAQAAKSRVALRLGVEGGSGFSATEAGHEKRLAAYVVEDPKAVPGIARLGPDALDTELTPDRLGALLGASGGSHLKTVLADQSVIAGIGNAYSDEILHAAGLSPFQPAARLDVAGIARLHAAMTSILIGALEVTDGVPPEQLKDGKRSTMRVHGRSGQACPTCGDTIRMVDMGTRVFQYCPTCQTGGRIYADRRMSRLLR